MASRRLTRDMIATIEEAIRRSAFLSEHAEIEREENALGSEIYARLIPVGEEKTVNRLPEYWVSTVSALGMYDSAERRTVTIKLPSRRAFPTAWARGSHDLELTYEETIAYYNIRDRKVALKSETEKLVGQAHRVLLSVTTVKQLVEAWPDVVQFLPPDALQPPPSRLLPAIILDDLTERLKRAGIALPEVEDA